MEKKTRESNFELLRIFAMLSIVMAHLTQHGIWFPPESPVNTVFLQSQLFQIWSGQLGNWIFVLISGYFVCTSKFSWKKVFILWFQIFTISAFLGLVAYFSKIPVIGFSNSDYSKLGFFEAAKPANKGDLFRCLLPCYFGNNWFATAYLVFYMFVPFLNSFRENLSKENHLKLIILMFVLACVVKQFPFQNFFQQDNLFLFILGYFVASYIRFYNPKILNHTKINAVLALCLMCAFALWNYLVYKYFLQVPFVKSHLNQILSFLGGGMPRFFSLTCAVLIFCVFKNLHAPYSRFINVVASASFGVYLFHENLLVNKFMWHFLLKTDRFVNSPFVLPFMFLSVLIVFSACTILELLRKQIVEKPVLNLIERLT